MIIKIFYSETIPDIRPIFIPDTGYPTNVHTECPDNIYSGYRISGRIPHTKKGRISGQPDIGYTRRNNFSISVFITCDANTNWGFLRHFAS